MKRFTACVSAAPSVAVGVLLLNDFVLKAAFHNALTGKLSDVAGLAAVTIFCCALWPRHVRTVGAVITALFVYWKSPYASDAIEAANAVLPFAIGRTVDYTDLLALPVVWLVCGNAHASAAGRSRQDRRVADRWRVPLCLHGDIPRRAFTP